MIWKTVTLLSLVVCVLGEDHAISEQKVIVRHKKISHIGSDKPEHHEEYAWSYPSYEFSYKVDDPHTHDNKGQEENREGDEVKGEYWLIEPDGRKRIVSYHADKEHGFKADVKYSEPHHHIQEDKKSYHIPHYPEVEHKGIIILDVKNKSEEEEEEEKEKYNEDRKAKASHDMPHKGHYRPMPYHLPIVKHEMEDSYHHPRFYRQNRRH